MLKFTDGSKASRDCARVSPATPAAVATELYVGSFLRARARASCKVKRSGAQWQIRTELHNLSKVPALMVRVKAVRSKSGDLIVPALYSDNYIALMPGEKQTISISLEDADTRGEKPRVRVDGYNIGTWVTLH